ncbi:MAG: hypothetical protein ACLFP4_01855 [Spirochaetales bacterium]
MGRHKQNKGAAGFESFYESLYGSRWPTLREALTGATVSLTLRLDKGRPYYLDPASALAALALDVSGASSIVDLCAAPGGKSLVIASQLSESARLICNERSSARRARLHRVLDEHLPADRRAHVTVTGHDATKWALHRPASAERVLADVPCSSEQHVLQSPGALAEWSPSRTKRLAQGAYAIACAAADTLLSAGRMVYSTCALSPTENDEVVRRVIARANGGLLAAATADAVHAAWATIAHDEAFGMPEQSRAEFGEACPGEATEYGWMIMPDRDRGMGPIYLAILTKAA